MSLVQKNDIKQIFAEQAPSIDKPASFANYPRGWDVARPNNGKPTIKQFNYLQQRTDQNILWMHQNGAALPYDATMEYAEGAVVVKDGILQQLKGGVWNPIGGGSTNTLNSIAELLLVKNPKSGEFVVVKSYHAGKGKGGGVFIYDSTKASINNGITIFNGWVRQYERLDVYMAGAYGDDVQDDTNAIQLAQDFIADTKWKGTYQATELNAGFGQELYFPAGLYRTTKPLLIAQGSTWIFEGNAQQINYNKLTGKRAMLRPDFTNVYDWVIKSNNYDVATGQLIPYDKLISGYEFDGAGTGNRLYTFAFGIVIKNLAIVAKKQTYGGVKLCCAQGSNIENFSITNCDYGLAASASFCSWFAGSTMHHKCGVLVGNECNQTFVEGYFNRYDKAGNVLPLANGTQLTIIASFNECQGVYCAPSQTVSLGSVTCEHNDYGLTATWTQVDAKAVYTENNKVFGVYLNNARLNIGIWGGLGDVQPVNVGYESQLTVGLYNKVNMSSTTIVYKPIVMGGTKNICVVNSGLNFWDDNVIYGGFDNSTFYVDAVNGKNEYHGMLPKFPIRNLNTALLRINNLQKNLTQQNKPYKICLMTNDTYNIGSLTLINKDITITNHGTSKPIVSNDNGECGLTSSNVAFENVTINSPAAATVYRIFRGRGNCELNFTGCTINLVDYKPFCLFENGLLTLTLASSAVNAASSTACRIATCDTQGSQLDYFSYSTTFNVAATNSNYAVNWASRSKVRSNLGVSTSYSATYTVNALAAGAVQTTTVAAVEASVGANINVSFSQYHADLEVSGVVSTQGNVTVKFRNMGTGSITLPQGTITVKLI